MSTASTSSTASSNMIYRCIIMKSLVLLLGIFSLSVGSSAQSLRDQYQREQSQQQADEMRRKEQSDRINQIKKNAANNGMSVSCESDKNLVFHNGIVWMLIKGELMYPERYTSSKNVLKWKSSSFNLSEEFYTDTNELFNSMGQRFKCRIDRGRLDSGTSTSERPAYCDKPPAGGLTGKELARCL